MASSGLNIAASPAVAGVESPTKYGAWLAAGYGIALLASVSVWFLAIGTPLWIDETLSYWQIAGGFHQIWSRSIQGNSFAAYAYILWLTNTLFGSEEIVLRTPSILAMLGATYVLYRCAKDLFSWDTALIATTMFVLPRGIAFAAIDARPYAFALLTTNLTILMFLRWMKTGRTKYAVYFGIAAASILYFHYLFATILAALAIVYLLWRSKISLADLRQIGVAAGCFFLVLLPVLPRLRYIYETRASHSFAGAPHPINLLMALNPGILQLLILLGALFLGALTRTLTVPNREIGREFTFCAIVGVLPVLLLYGLSVLTSVHVFIPRYLLVGVPGLTLLWAWVVNLTRSRAIRLVFCVAFVGLCVFQAYSSPMSRLHEESWKEALAFADTNAATDGAPVLMCSSLVEADYQPMPEVPSQSVLFAPLSYYKIKAPVVPLPRTLNQEARDEVAKFLLTAAPEHRRFLLMFPLPSVPIAQFLHDSSQENYEAHPLGNFDGIWVVEFLPNS